MELNVFQRSILGFRQNVVRQDQTEETDECVQQRNAGQRQRRFQIVISLLCDEPKHVVCGRRNTTCNATRSGK